MFFRLYELLFEIDLPYEDKQKGPSKENRHDLLSGKHFSWMRICVPVAMQMYPGNESESRISEKSSKK